MLRLPRSVPIIAASLALAACDLPTSVGGNNRIVVAVPKASWQEIETAVGRSLEPRSFTVRNERIFEVAHVDPAESEDWIDFRKVRQVLVIGEAADPWVAEALEEVDGTIPRGPVILRAENVWSRPQLVTILLLPPGSQPEMAAEMMPEVGAQYVERLEEYARQRMFVTGEKTELADSLARIAGFSLRVPQVYEVTEPQVGVFIFRNDQPDPAELIRQVTVTRRPNDEVEMTPEAALDWRADVVSRTTTPPHVTESIQMARTDLRLGDRPAVEIQTTWSNPPGEWPAGGPVITRMIRCPEYTYLTDAWLYAPGEAKYEYMVQLQTILNSFSCAQ